MNISAEEYSIKHGDPRVLTYPFMSSPKPTVVITLAYLVFVKLVGPALMKNRPAFQLRTLLVIYNTILVIFSSWAFLKIFYRFLAKYNFRCQSVDYSNNADALEMLEVCWWFYISKMVEFADTIFFVLRKKDSQVSFLHVIHHTLTPLTVWATVKYGAGGSILFYCMNNSFVHIWMYLYYGLSGMGPGIQKYLWWKKYLTSLQLLQFAADIFYHCGLIFFPPEHCKVPLFLVNLLLLEFIFYFILFTDFYLKSYQKKSHKA